MHAGVGVRVRVVAGDLVQVAEVGSGRGYQSHWETRLRCGPGPHARVVPSKSAGLASPRQVFPGTADDRTGLILMEGLRRYGLSMMTNSC